MPASMIMALAGLMRKVSGSSRAMAAGGPSPGMMPTTVPRNTPTKHQSRFAGCSASANPCIRPPKTSTSGQRYAEREREDDVETRRDADGHQRRDHRRPSVHHGNDEEAQRREGNEEAGHLDHHDRNRECRPGGEGASNACPFDFLVFFF